MMGLYLAIFENDTELAGVEVGSYDDFDSFRNAVVESFGGRRALKQFPFLLLHSDCDGEWLPSEAKGLERELEIISARLREKPAIQLLDWKLQVAATVGLKPRSLYDCFFDIDGEPLLERLVALARLSQSVNLPILFQ